MKLNGARHRRYSVPRAAENGQVRIHLGPGRKKLLEGWINIDANAFTGKCDIWADLRNALPLPDECADAVYSHHVVEHLPDLGMHFREVSRVLKPGGVYRVAGPNGDSAVRKFLEGDIGWFGQWPDRYESIGGRFVNFVFCRNEHLTMLSESYLQELAELAGFPKGKVKLPCRDTDHLELFAGCLSREHESDFAVPHTLVMEFPKIPNIKNSGSAA